MPGTRLNDTERHLQEWWNAGGNARYPALRHISVRGEPGIRGIKKLDIDFDNPLTVICGKNGSGKTTVLALAALGFHSPQDHKPINARRRPKQGENYTYYTFQDFFFKGPSDPDITGIEISWTYNGTETISIKKRTEKWMHYERRPERPVHYLGMIRIVPPIEQNVLRIHFKSNVSEITIESLNPIFRGYLCDIMGKNYDEADILSSSSYSLRKLRKCKVGDSSFSSFNLGSGEDVLIDFLYLLQECPKGSLILVEEIELGIHPEALIRLAKYLQEIILEKRLQVIISTHSEYFIDSVPQVSRVLIQRSNQECIITKGPTTRFAMGIMAGRSIPELNIYCEDYFAELLIKQSLSNNVRSRVHIVPVGSNSELLNQALFHIRGEFGQHVLILWDGDRKTRADAKKWIKNLVAALKSRRDVDILNKFREKVNWVFLPGDDVPETWLINKLNCPEGIVNLTHQLNCGTESEAEILIDELSAVGEPHNISFELSKKSAIDEDEAQRLLIRSISGMTSKPLEPIYQKVKSVLEGKKIKQKFSDLA